MAKILIYSPSPMSATGYGTAVRYILPRLIADGHEVQIYGYNGQPAEAIDYHGARLWPRSISVFDVVPHLAEREKPDIVMAVCDPWIVDADSWRKVKTPRLAFWFPCHAAPLSPEFGKVLDVADTLMSYSQFGQATVRQSGLSCEYVPLGFEPSIYHPHDKVECRAWFQAAVGRDIGDGSLIGMVAANAHTLPKDRKGFGIALAAFAEYRRNYPEDNALFYIHTRPDTQMGGDDIYRLAEICGVEHDVLFPSLLDWVVAIPDATMAKLYGAFDVLLAPSRAEGFGLPHLEAQACGAPVVMTDFSSMPELFYMGELVKPAQLEPLDSIGGGWYAQPSIDATARALGKVLSRPIGEVPYADMVERYSWDSVYNRLIEALGL